MAVLMGEVSVKRAGVVITMATVYGVEFEYRVNERTGKVYVEAAGTAEKLSALHRAAPFRVTKVLPGYEVKAKSYDFGKSMGLGKKPVL
ncbi:hypothetical protein SEA_STARPLATINUM_286 [Streptomyces phage StarPlatinum]|uniref:Uncharacterized protein n=1 Tax=Streptomyces phage StarPlatinum TaxID=2283265 RepID=A0A345M918_9CAUD|nr:hypothetical protein HWB77_gp016 [Streptomyces phage StarPlatinum]YP_009839679.1 hypothetical protein HWB77_gp047 [Streptomyces phage StarPlatinum]AXH66765.1 hypothetical protein SEA_STARPLATINUM_16 [Streptomyces phage StarPlatinum]AXH66989.1 hypothetical protein SEA_STARPLATINUM_286 [Streptomyces phage StarPlatinum]